MDALKEARYALAEFREIAAVALSEAQSDVQRTAWWIQHEQKMRWTGEIRRRTEKLNLAKSELFRAQLSANDPSASCLEQKKMVQRAEHALNEAQQKLEFVKKWGRVLDREMMLFKGKLQPIGRAVEGEIPKGEAKLEIMIDRLEAYLRIQAPQAPKAAPAPDPEKSP